MGITTEQGMVWGVESLKQTQFCYLASRKGCCLEQAVNFGRVQCTCVRVCERGDAMPKCMGSEVPLNRVRGWGSLV